MNKKIIITFITLIVGYFIIVFGANSKVNQTNNSNDLWEVDFIDDFDTFNLENWQDQRIWVNNEKQCYVPNGDYNTREVSEGTLKIRVVNLGDEIECDNLDKFGKQHPQTPYVAGRIASKNRKEFIKGKWTARLRVVGGSQKSMFPAWWILGAQNNESPVQEENENICWPMTGSGEIDIFEHHGDYNPDHFTTGAIKNLGECDKGDWWSYRAGYDVSLSEFHEYSVEWEKSDLVYRLDGKKYIEILALEIIIPNLCLLF
jgi:beta-glucanase (GH16 family)